MVKSIYFRYKIVFPVVFLMFFATDLNAQGSGSSLYGDFPYARTLIIGSDDMSGIARPAQSNGETSNKANMINTGMRLTENKGSQFGAIYFNNCKFSSINGIKIEFEYMIYGGNGGNKADGADGIAMFLFDASVSNPTVGATGSSLGYTYNRALGRTNKSKCAGLSGAYLGVGLDVFGNFKFTRWGNNERKGGGELAPNSYSGEYGSHVTVRGGIGPGYNKEGMNSPTTSGYPVLITRSTLAKTGTEEDKRNRVLGTDGEYFLLTRPNFSGFSLRGGSVFNREQDKGYRKAIIELYPIPGFNEGDPPRGMYVTVKIKYTSNNRTVTATIIEDYQYMNQLKYRETACPLTSDNSGTSGPYKSEVLTMNATPPAFMRLGFSASTGGYYDNHIIKNLLITLPCSAEANDDEAQIIRGNKIVAYPLQNDIAYTGPVSRDNVGSSEYIDPESFWFVDSATGQPSYKPHELTNNQGKWKYNKNTREVTFLPNKGFEGEAQVKYSIKGGINGEMPYADEAYRSNLATIITKVAPAKCIVANRMISSVFR